MMELFSSTRRVIPTFKRHSNLICNEFPVIPLHHRRLFNPQIHPCRFLVSSKKSSFQGFKSCQKDPEIIIARLAGIYQSALLFIPDFFPRLDFQEFTKPKRLLPTKELAQGPSDKIISSPENSLYKVRLCTSSFYGSDLSNLNAGILVCLIDENGDSLLERIPAILSQAHQQSGDAVASDVIRFQRGSIDEFIFGGPKLGKIQAMWIGLDSGSWRIGGGASLTTFSADDYKRDETSEIGSTYCTVTYNFENEDVLLGEGSDLAMTELRPCLVTEHFGADSISIIEGSAQGISRAEKGITNEDSMKEYADLKNSLLLYDAVLIFSGTCITSITAGNNTALAFLTGGVGGFLYLVLLQRSVDKLPAPESSSMSITNEGDNWNRLLEGGKGPVVVFLFAFAVAVLAMRLDKPEVIETLTPREVLAGMVGFLACKVSVVLAAFNPVSSGMKDNKLSK